MCFLNSGVSRAQSQKAVDVGASGCDSSRDSTNGVAILAEHEEVVVDVVAVIQWHVVEIGWLWALDFGGDADHEGLRQSGGVGRRGTGNEAMWWRLKTGIRGCSTLPGVGASAAFLGEVAGSCQLRGCSR